MKIVEPRVTEVKDFEGTDNFYKSVARAARICYASDKTTDNIELVRRLIKSKHYSPFAHAIVYIDYNRYPGKINKYEEDILFECVSSEYSIELHGGSVIAINGRLIVESCVKIVKKYPEITLDTLDVLDSFLLHLKTIETEVDDGFKSFIVDTSIGCTREMNRHHENLYICEQSTRYCNFMSNKFSKELSINKPYWYDNADPEVVQEWVFGIVNCEGAYYNILDCGLSIDEARGVLPLDTHTRAIYTTTIQEWNHIIDLRHKGTTGKPHGDIAIIAGMINEMIN